MVNSSAEYPTSNSGHYSRTARAVFILSVVRGRWIKVVPVDIETSQMILYITNINSKQSGCNQPGVRLPTSKRLCSMDEPRQCFCLLKVESFVASTPRCIVWYLHGKKSIVSDK
ncbi:hypothetical protein RvY_07176 [Ramazzottius varieornatus]|uniref:Uncharacterized protein n=1 Tax=Ramazzottius varieornatus TaxID=947166 RepID=A0A1D1VAN7_RAMVA|nr:hypothetical protein RvY_07176 [Ramazzottius varieornatus]